MTQLFDLRSTASRFRTVALLEAVSWAGLLTGMFFKYVPDPGNEIGVKVFGWIHGIIFHRVFGGRVPGGARVPLEATYLVARTVSWRCPIVQCDLCHMGRQGWQVADRRHCGGR